MYNGKLPFEMHYEICNNLSFNEKSKIKFLNKDFYKLWYRDIKNAKIINKFLKKLIYLVDLVLLNLLTEYQCLQDILQPFRYVTILISS